MDQFGIFIEGALNWEDLINVLSRYLKDSGSCLDDSRHLWERDNFEILAIYRPNYVDDCGIPFSHYTCEISLTDLKLSDATKRLEEMNKLAKMIKIELGQRIENGAVLIRNLQTIIE